MGARLNFVGMEVGRIHQRHKPFIGHDP